MTRVWLYIMGAIENSDHVTCAVPWRVDKELIFFGPCMKRIRRSLRKEYLSPSHSCREVSDDLYMVGVNGCNAEKIRKVVWAGKLLQVMTFAEADRRLRGSRFEKMRGHSSTPLHVRPLLENGRLVGYEHVGEEHLKDQKWIYDLSSSAFTDEGSVQVEGQRLILAEGTSAWGGFDLDICMLLANLFFARGRGIDFDEEALAILKGEQPEKSGIDKYAIFGRTGSKANPRRSHGLPMDDDVAVRFIAWVRRRAAEVAGDQREDEDVPPKTRCP